MSVISPKTLILSLTQPWHKLRPLWKMVSEIKSRKLEEKITIISQILKDNPILKGDPEVMARLFYLPKGKYAVKAFRRELMLEASKTTEENILMFHEAMPDQEKVDIIRSSRFDKGHFDFSERTLTFSEEALKKIGNDNLWDFINKYCVKTLVIQKEGDSISYNERLIRLLLQKKPQALDLMENYKLKFLNFDPLFVQKGKLLLYGSFFEMLFHSGLKECQNKTIDFSQSVVSLNMFCKILQKIETGKKDLPLSNEEYQIACDYLQFSDCYPEGTFGPGEWELHWGIKVDDVPPIPKELLEALEKPCPFKSVKRALYLIPKDVSLDKMGELAKNPFLGHENGYRYYFHKIKVKYGKETVKNSYWILKVEELISGSRGKTRDEQLKLATDQGYEAPSLLEEVICNSAHYVKTGEALLSKDEKDLCTCCREEKLNGWKLIVGGFSPAGLRIDINFEVLGFVGVAPVLRK